MITRLNNTTIHVKFVLKNPTCLWNQIGVLFLSLILSWKNHDSSDIEVVYQVTRLLLC